MAEVRLDEQELSRLLGSGNGDACLLYLYIKSHGVLSLTEAAEALHMEQRRLELALALLTQLGLTAMPTAPAQPQPEMRRYTERELLKAQREDPGFKLLVGEAQRRLGRTLSGEELKTLLGLRDYLHLPTEVIGLLIHYCIQRCRSRDSSWSPSMRIIEKEGYAWSEQGIDTVEAAANFMSHRLQLHAAVGRYRILLGIQDRRLTTGEERYMLQWTQLCMPDEVIARAYERTCEATGGLKWAYMNAILQRWAEQGLHTLAEIEQSDAKPARQPNYTRGKGAQPAPGDLRQPVAAQQNDFERRAVEQLRQRKED